MVRKMAITKIAPARSADAVVRYLTQEESHDGIHARIGSFSIRNMSLTGAAREIRGVMRKYGKEKNIEAYVIVQSFAEEELNPDKQEDLDKANEAGMRLARKYGGDDRQVMVVTQADNGKVHNHILLASTDTLTGKALRGANTRHPLLMQYSDEILKEMGITNQNEGKTRAKDRQSMGEIKRREQGLYVWKDDLKERIKKSLGRDGVVDGATFIQDMERQNVDVRINGKGNVSYRFEDEEGKDRKCRASRLGEDFGKEGLKLAFEENQKKQKRTLIDWDKRMEERQKAIEREREEVRAKNPELWAKIQTEANFVMGETPKPVMEKPKVEKPKEEIPTPKVKMAPKKKEEIPQIDDFLKKSSFTKSAKPHNSKASGARSTSPLGVPKASLTSQNKELEEQEQARRVAQQLEEAQRKRREEIAEEKKRKLDARTKAFLSAGDELAREDQKEHGDMQLGG